MCLIKAGRAITEGFLTHSTLNSSSTQMVEREMCLFNFYVQKEILLGAYFFFFSIHLINDHLNPRKKFLKLNQCKNIHLNILLR